VIALFTKFDALDNKAFGILRKENLSRTDARKEAPNRAKADFDKTHLSSFYDKPYPPRNHVCLRGMMLALSITETLCSLSSDMNKEDASCDELVSQTAAALDSEVLQQLLVSTQQTNLGLCIEYSLKR